jgi:DNA-binding LacI/PurR family transcriptional regulator
MSARRPTISDVAAAAGVSRTTVSHALNGKGRVEAGTRRRVEEAAARLGYHASPTAAGLRRGRTSTVGMMLPVGGTAAHRRDLFAVEFYLDIAVEAARAAFGRGHALTLLPDALTAAELRRFPLDGVVVHDPVIDDPRVAAIEAVGLPFVTIERMLDRPEHRRWVAADTVGGTRAALDHLADAGAGRIALISGDQPWAWYRDTEDAYRTWCAERGLPARVVGLDAAAFQSHGSGPAVAALLDGGEAPDAVFTAPDVYALDAAGDLRARGLVVGRDVLLACGVDSIHVRAHHPPITAVDLAPHDQAQAAVELLLDEGAAGPRVSPAVLRPRASTRAGQP